MTPTTGVQTAKETAEHLILAKLDEVGKEVSAVKGLTESTRANVAVIAVKLFGSQDADKESDKGRLPQVEASARASHRRLNAIDTRMAKYAGGLALAGFLLGLLAEWGRH